MIRPAPAGEACSSCSTSGRNRPPMTTALRILLIINVGIWLLGALIPPLQRIYIDWLASTPVDEIGRLRLWQMVTSMFLHLRLRHLVGNMFILWMVGGHLERELGTRRFVVLYLLSGVAGDLGHLALRWGSDIPSLGASGAVFGVLGATAVLLGDMQVYVWGILPMRMRRLVLILIALELLVLLTGVEDGIGHAAHLAGGVAGYLLALKLAHPTWRSTKERRAPHSDPGSAPPRPSRFQDLQVMPDGRGHGGEDGSGSRGDG